MNAKFPIPKKTIVVQSQVWRRNSPQPSRSSWKKGFDSTTSARRGRWRGAHQHGGRDQDHVPWQPIRPDAGSEDDAGVRDLARGEDEPERDRRVRDLEHGKGERDVRDPVTDARDRRAREEQAEISLGQRSDGKPHRRESTMAGWSRSTTRTASRSAGSGPGRQTAS